MSVIHDINLRRQHCSIGGMTAFVLLCVALTGCQRQSATAAPFAEPADALAAVPLSQLSKICFTRGDFIYLRDVVSGRETKLSIGQSPEMSPDGERVVFIAPETKGEAGSWRVKVLDLRTNRVEEFVQLSRLHAYNLRWSHSSKKIAFESADGGQGTMFGQFDPVTNEWKVITRSTDLRVNGSEGPFALSSWVPTDESVLIHSLKNVYEVSLAGKIAWQLSIAELNIHSETRFSLTMNRRYLLFDSVVDTKDRPANDVVKLFDMSTKNLTVITPDTVEARTPIWVNSDKAILFTCMRRFDHPHRPSICAIGVDGTGLSVVVDGGQQPSYSAN
jgi:Tol biopolymer transport system component